LLSKTQENQVTLKFTIPTPDGGNFSLMKVNSFQMLRTTLFLTLMEIKMRKAEMLTCIRDITVPTRDGRLSTLTNRTRSVPRVLIQTSVSTRTDHSTSDLDFHSKELYSATVLITST
jgi:hypothetical protein